MKLTELVHTSSEIGMIVKTSGKDARTTDMIQSETNYSRNTQINLIWVGIYITYITHAYCSLYDQEFHTCIIFI